MAFSLISSSVTGKCMESNSDSQSTELNSTWMNSQVTRKGNGVAGVGAHSKELKAALKLLKTFLFLFFIFLHKSPEEALIHS